MFYKLIPPQINVCLKKAKRKIKAIKCSKKKSYAYPLEFYRQSVWHRHCSDKCIVHVHTLTETHMHHAVISGVSSRENQSPSCISKIPVMQLWKNLLGQQQDEVCWTDKLWFVANGKSLILRQTHLKSFTETNSCQLSNGNGSSKWFSDTPDSPVSLPGKHQRTHNRPKVTKLQVKEVKQLV